VSNVDPFRYWAFISYSHADARWADWLHKGLERYRIPARLVGRETPTGKVPKKLFPVFRDRDELAGSSELGPALQKALRESRCQIVIASPNSARSRWVNEEIRYFKSLGRSSRVLALVVDGEPNATDKGPPALECFPEALRFRVDAQGRPTGEPAELIAADARAHADGKAHALLKLIAGIVGVGFDDLRQRELQARNRRLAIFASIATAIAAVTLVLAAVAYQARNDALRRQQQAEDLLEFMLGDLRGKLEPIGKLAILDAVGNKAMEYFATLEQEDLTDTALASRAKALFQISEVRIKQGDLAGAADACRESTRLYEELVRRHPRRTDYAHALALSVWSIGVAHYAQGEFAQARPWLERYAETAQQLLSLEPANPEWLHMAAQSQVNLGAIAFRRHDLASAQAAFAAAAAHEPALLDAEPPVLDYVDSFADVHGWMYMVAVERRDWRAALRHATRHAELHRRMLSLAPENANYRSLVATANSRVLRAEAQLRPLAPDAPALRELLRVADELVALDPDNIEFGQLRGVALDLAVDANLGAGELAAAAVAADDALALAQAIWRRAPADARARRELQRALVQAIKVSVLQGKRAAAQARSRQARALPPPRQPDSLLVTLQFDLDLLEWWLAAGTPEAADAEVRTKQTLEQLEAMRAPARPELMLRYAALRGDPAQAARWLGQLTEIERRHPFVREFCRATGACGAPA
jgi:eukaryotic-like serine/threonine-protein kinase